jgi:hypothetical protein
MAEMVPKGYVRSGADRGQVRFAEVGDSLVTPDGSSFAQSSFVGARIFRTAPQALVISTWQNITFPTGSVSSEWDTHGFHNPASNSHLLKVPSGQAGYYHAKATLRIGTGDTTNIWRGMYLGHLDTNDSTVIALSYVHNRLVQSGDAASLCTVADWYMTAGQSVVIRFNPLTHANLDALGGSTGLTSLSLRKVG